MVQGKQLMVACWHIDDLKVSHKVSTVGDQFITDMEDEFGKEMPLNKSWGKIHDYLGMTLDFSKQGEVTFMMIDYIKSILHNAPKEMCSHAATLATNHLFEVNNTDPVYLNADKAEI